MACDIGTTLFVLQFSLEPDVSYIVGIYLSEEDAKVLANDIIGTEPTWLPKRTNSLHLAGYTNPGVGYPAYIRGVNVSIEEHTLSAQA